MAASVNEPLFLEAFKFFDTHGLPLAIQIEHGRSLDVVVSVPQFYFDALKAKWSTRRALAAVEEALVDTGASRTYVETALDWLKRKTHEKPEQHAPFSKDGLTHDWSIGFHCVGHAGKITRVVRVPHLLFRAHGFDAMHGPAHILSVSIDNKLGLDHTCRKNSIIEVCLWFNEDGEWSGDLRGKAVF